MINVFLGGTCANNNWRESFTAALVAAGVPAETIFNPVLPTGQEWTQVDADREHEAKDAAKFNLFYIADPQQDGNTFSAYSTCEAIMGLYDDCRAIVVFDQSGMESHGLKAMKQIAHDLKRRFPTGRIYEDSARAVQYLADALGCNES